MNVINEIKRLNERELKSTDSGASWHDDYKDSAYVFVGGLPYQLTEGDVLAIFSQYGEIEDINLVRDPETGKSKGFAFLQYEDQRSTVLAVDNFNGIRVLGRILRVDHCREYKSKQMDSFDDESKAQEFMERERKKLMALRTGEGVLDRHSASVSDSDEDKPGGKDSYLKAIEEKKRGQDQMEREREQIAVGLGLEEDDPMREYLIDKELKKRRRESKKASREQKKKRHASRSRSPRSRRHRSRTRSRSPPRRNRSSSRDRREYSSRSSQKY